MHIHSYVVQFSLYNFYYISNDHDELIKYVASYINKYYIQHMTT